MLDPDSDQPLVGRGIWYVITESGLRTAWNSPANGADLVKCPVCRGRRAVMPDCAECAGRGVVDHVPYADRPWDEIVPNLWLGGHACQFNSEVAPEGNCFIREEDGFDLVISLAYQPGFSPPLWTEHHTHRMADAELDPDHHSRVDELAELVQMSVQNGRKTLVRCLAGLNRSALVTGLALTRMGYAPDEAIRLMRQKRSPYVLCNPSFVDYIHAATSAATNKEKK